MNKIAPNTLEQITEVFSNNITKDSLLAQKCIDSYFLFIKEFWSVIVHGDPKWNWHIPYLCAELKYMVNLVGNDKPKEYDLIVNIPPGTTKSLACTVFLPAWAWTKFPWMKFIKTSHSGSLSLEHAELTRDIVISEKYQRFYPHIRIKQDNSAKSKFKIVYQDTKKENVWVLGGGLYSTSVNATVTGFHSHVKLTDDPLDPTKALSDTQLKSCNQWLSQNLSSRNIDKKVTPHIIIMQRVHKQDPSGEALKSKKKGKKVKHICLPGDVHAEGNRDRVRPQALLKYYDAQGGYLDPVRLDKDAINEMEINLGQYGKKSQVDQNPETPGAGMFKSDNFHIVDQYEGTILQTVRYWDKAGTQDGGAYSVGVKMSKLSTGKFLVQDVKRGQWATEVRERNIKKTMEADGHLVHSYIEQEPGSGGKESAESTIRNNAGYKIFADRPTGDKVFRADPYSVQVNNGNVLLMRGDWNDLYKDEHSEFPFGKYKDQVDASSGGFNKLAGKKIARSY